MTAHAICDACECVSHCSKNGCIPLTPIFRAPSVGCSGETNAQALECLIEVKDRMELCIREGLTAYEAFDSFYAEMVDDAIAACAATGETS